MNLSVLLDMGRRRQPELHAKIRRCQMNHTAPHYLLFTQAKDLENESVPGGRWRFVLEEIGSQDRIEEAEFEPGIVGERLQLLVVIRGLEAIEHAARVTLITPSKYVGRGIRMHLANWKQNDWRWESFGRMTPIKHHDLWQRIDRAMGIHQINCRVWQFDPPQEREQPSPVSVANHRFDNAHELPDSHKTKSSNQGLQVDNRYSTRTRIVLKPRRTREAHQQHLASNGAHLATKIKPVGQGRAFGYAIN